MTEYDVERVARAICEADGQDPDRLEPGDDPYQGREGYPSPCIDGYNRKDDPCHFAWRRYDGHARAAITALGDMREACDIAPTGWWCSREAGHEGPCAARETHTVEPLKIAESALRTARRAILRCEDTFKAETEITRALWHIRCELRARAALGESDR